MLLGGVVRGFTPQSRPTRRTGSVEVHAYVSGTAEDTAKGCALPGTVRTVSRCALRATRRAGLELTGAVCTGGFLRTTSLQTPVKPQRAAAKHLDEDHRDDPEWHLLDD